VPLRARAIAVNGREQTENNPVIATAVGWQTVFHHALLAARTSSVFTI
jgi:hypothetical protein